MKKLFVDTNIVIDLLARREHFYPAAADLFSLADRKKVGIQISALSMANTHYIILKFEDSAKAKRVLRDLSTLALILELNQKIIELALNDDDFKDFEDALQYLWRLRMMWKLSLPGMHKTLCIPLSLLCRRKSF